MRRRALASFTSNFGPVVGRYGEEGKGGLTRNFKKKKSSSPKFALGQLVKSTIDEKIRGEIVSIKGGSARIKGYTHTFATTSLELLSGEAAKK